MRNSTSRALRATATVAGMAALGVSFAGTAAAAPSDAGTTYMPGGAGSESPGFGKDGLSDSHRSPHFTEPGLVNFEMPSLKTNTDMPYDEGDESKGDESKGDEHTYGNKHGKLQDPVQDKGDHVGEGDLQLLGYDRKTHEHDGRHHYDHDDYMDHFVDRGGMDRGGMDRDASMRTSSSDSGLLNRDGMSLYKHNEHTHAYRNRNEPDDPYSMDKDEGHGLSGHKVIIPL
ncbi:MAG: hypothetical protein JO100_01300 [Pseudonocardia sp.]|nr:hypothetical protein [Pseudonocardia sp.]